MSHGRIRELEGKRHRLLREAREAWDGYEAISDKSGTDAQEARTKYDNIRQDYDNTEHELRQAESDWREGLALREMESRDRDVVEDRERGRAADPNAPDTDLTESQLLDDDNYRNAYWNAVRYGIKELSSDERSIIAKGMERRASTTAGPVTTGSHIGSGTSAGSDGGLLIPRGFMARLIEAMKFTGPMVPGGGLCYDFSTEHGNKIDIPTVNDTAHDGEDTPAEAERIKAAVVAGTNQVNDNDDPDFGQVTFGSQMMDSKFIKVTYELLQDSGIDALEGILARFCGERIGRRANSTFTTKLIGANGIGTSKATQYGAGGRIEVGKANTDETIASVTPDILRSMIHSIEPAYRGQGPRGPARNGGLVWMFNDSTLEHLSTMRLKATEYKGASADNTHTEYAVEPYIFQLSNDFLNDEPDLMLGRPFAINQNMPAGTAGTYPIVIGDFQHCWIRTAGPMRSVVARERFIEKLLVGFLAFQRMDMQIVEKRPFRSLYLHT